MGRSGHKDFGINNAMEDSLIRSREKEIESWMPRRHHQQYNHDDNNIMHNKTSIIIWRGKQKGINAVGILFHLFSIKVNCNRFVFRRTRIWVLAIVWQTWCDCIRGMNNSLQIMSTIYNYNQIFGSKICEKTTNDMNISSYFATSSNASLMKNLYHIVV